MRVASTLFVALSLVACGGGGTGTDAGAPERAACEEIIERCHELDIGTGEIHECHEFAEAEDVTNEGCVAMREHCFEVCVATDAGPGVDAAHDD